MRIAELHIQRCGVWQDLQLQLPHSGLNLLYGPNETGKSTLLRMIRGVLYGFPNVRVGQDPTGADSWAGALDLEHDGRRVRVQRTAQAGTRGHVSVSSLDQEQVPLGYLEHLLHGVDENLFEQVFAVGLTELENGTTLHSGDVADRIHGLTLGPDGQRLITAGSLSRQAGRSLWDSSSRQGRLLELQSRHAQITADLKQLDKRQRQHRELTRDKHRTDEEIASFRERQAGLEQELRGAILLQRAWQPWNHVHACEAALEDLAIVQDFPVNGVDRLARLEQDLAAAQKARQELLQLARQARKQAARLGLDPELRRHAPAIQGLLDQRDWIAQSRRRVAEIDQRIDTLKAELDAQLEQLGPPWSAKRLEAFDASPAGQFHLISRGRSFRQALGRRNRCERWVKRFEAACAERSTALSADLARLGCDDISQALPLARKQLHNLERIRELKLQQQELANRLEGIDEERERLEAQLILPPWVYLVLSGFGLAGLALLAAGLNKGLTLSLVVGAVYTLLVVTCGGLCWALKHHFEQETELQLDDVNDEADEHRQALRDTHAVARELITPDLLALNKATGASAEQFSEADLIQYLTQRIAELERLALDERRLQRRRQLLQQARQRYQQSEKEVGTARQAWQEFLATLGFAPSLAVDEACETWRSLALACDTRQQLLAAQSEGQLYRGIVQAFDDRVQTVARRLQNCEITPQQAWDVLHGWEQKLLTAAAQREERRKFRKDAQHRLREAGEYLGIVHDLKTQRAALLVQAGASTSDEFLERAAQAERRSALLEELDGAQRELELAAQTAPDLALVEEDLIRYDEAETREQIAVMRQELKAVDLDLEAALERLGSLKHELKQLESDRTSTHLRFEREQVETQLRQAGEEWLAIRWASAALDGLRGHFERTCQPVTLAEASRYLQRMTGGKYRNIWTPLGERELRIDDDQHRTWQIDQLSRGTREQLFLSIRLALASELSRQGTNLPLILDDVLVNFDQTRAEAAVDVLRDFGQQGHQILLFTCHRHLAEQAASQGWEPVWLRTPSVAMAERRAG